MADEINPNHPVTRAMHAEYHKLLALLVGLDCDGTRTITLADFDRFSAKYPDAVIVVHGHADSIELRLVSRQEAEHLAREHGGLPL